MDILYLNDFSSAGLRAASFLADISNSMFSLLIVLTAIDYLTWMAASWVQRLLAGRAAARALARKLLIFAMIVLAHAIDALLWDRHLLRDAATFYYLINAAISIIENVSRAGIPIPPFLYKAITAFKNHTRK